MGKWGCLKTCWQKWLSSLKGLVFRLQRLHPMAHRLGSKDDRTRMEAFEQLLQMGDPAVPIFIQVLTAPPSQIFAPRWDSKITRKLAVEGLARLKSKKSVKPMIEFLEGKDRDFVKCVVWALGEILGLNAVPALIPFLGDLSEIGGEAAENLQKLGAGEIVNAFQRLIYKRDVAALKTLRP